MRKLNKSNVAIFIFMFLLFVVFALSLFQENVISAIICTGFVLLFLGVLIYYLIFPDIKTDEKGIHHYRQTIKWEDVEYVDLYPHMTFREWVDDQYGDDFDEIDRETLEQYKKEFLKDRKADEEYMKEWVYENCNVCLQDLESDVWRQYIDEFWKDHKGVYVGYGETQVRLDYYLHLNDRQKEKIVEKLRRMAMEQEKRIEK